MWSKLDVDACEKALERWLRSDEPAPEHEVDMLRRCAAWHAHGERLRSVAEEYEDAVARGAEDGSRLLLPDKMMAFLLDEANARDSLTAQHLQLARHLVSYLPMEKRSNQCSVCRWALLNEDPAVRRGAAQDPSDFAVSQPSRAGSGSRGQSVRGPDGVLSGRGGLLGRRLQEGLVPASPAHLRVRPPPPSCPRPFAGARPNIGPPGHAGRATT